MINKVRKRDGKKQKFDTQKIYNALLCAFKSKGQDFTFDTFESFYSVYLEPCFPENATIIDIEDLQDLVEKALQKAGYYDVAKEYIIYRDIRTRERKMRLNFFKSLGSIYTAHAKDSDLKRENANIDGNTPMGIMLKVGSEATKEFVFSEVLPIEQSKAHLDGDIHIHDSDFLPTTETCCQISLKKHLKQLINTGHGSIREAKSIYVAAAKACIIVQSNQNDQHGGQSIFDFDYGLAPYVRWTYIKHISDIADTNRWVTPDKYEHLGDTLVAYLRKHEDDKTILDEVHRAELMCILQNYVNAPGVPDALDYLLSKALEKTNRDTYQAMESFVHNLNTMHSRAGAQVPFSSINYGTDTSPEGRMVILNVLKATDAGLGLGETPIFPIQIFKVKEGINYNEGDPNYDLFRKAILVSAKRLFPNFSFIDAPFNLRYYIEGRPETEIAYMGCRTRVIGNVYDPSREIVAGRGNLSFTSINLPRLAIEAKGDLDKFYKSLDDMMTLVVEQLLFRFEIQCSKHVYNYPFLMGQGVWIDSDKLKKDDSVAEILKHGTLSIGFIGLAETLVALTGKHHGESEDSQKLGLEIISFMRNRMDKEAKDRKLNFSLLATPAEGLSGRFVKLDAKKYGIIPGVTDKNYYTNSFHIPVSYHISIKDKLRLEGPYHALTNAGHISYIELDGDPQDNPEVMEKAVRYMHDYGIGYGAINHPVDFDPVCGFRGVINGDICPCCGRKETDAEPFERIRRITGYLVGTLDRFNDGKRAEVDDRVAHNTVNELDIF